jgi:Uma2 family endonuclease
MGTIEMSQSAKHQASYSDLFDLAENVVGEIINGELHTHPRPAPRHARASTALTGSLWNPFDRGSDGPGGWWIFDEPELHLGTDILVPDLAGWRREHMPSLPATAWFELAPDWACEILSPSTTRSDRITKMPVYAREGVKHLWLIDPDLKTLEVYELNPNKNWTLISALKDDDPIRQPPFDAIEFSLEALWA